MWIIFILPNINLTKFWSLWEKKSYNRLLFNDKVFVKRYGEVTLILINTFVYLSICGSPSMSIYLSVCLFISVCVSIYLSVSIYIPMHACLSIYLCMHVYLSIYLCIYLWMNLTKRSLILSTLVAATPAIFCLSIYLSDYISMNEPD